MEDMKDNALKVQFRNRLRDDCQLSYCRVQIKYLQPIVTQYLVCNKSEIWP